MRRPIGIREVAEAAGVSITTVSHALNGKGRLNDETRRRVQIVAKELGYRPNAIARNLAGGRSGLIGLAVAQTLEGQFAVSDFAYYAQLMSAATVEAIDHGYALVLASGAKGGWSTIRLDGLIVVDPIHDDPLSTEFKERGIPVVTTGRVPGQEDGYWVDNDHRAGTRSILDFLSARGAQQIALIASPPVTSYVMDAHEAYEQWCAERGQEAMVAVARHDLTESAGFDATRELLRGRRRPDAVYATLDRLALGVLLAAQSEGLTVPSDLQVAGCTDSDAGKNHHPSLTALALDPEQIGREAVAMIAHLIEGAEPPQPHVSIPTTILPRESTLPQALATPRPVAEASGAGASDAGASDAGASDAGASGADASRAGR